jgi:ferritin-like metal-binding protein YciE
MKSTNPKAEKKRSLQDGKRESELGTPETNEGCRSGYIEELKEIYFAEKALIVTIPAMITKAATKELADSFRTHYEFTINHIKRLEAIFCSIGEFEIVTKYEAMHRTIKPIE